MSSFNPDRRTVLKASGLTIAALAGCLSGGDSSGENGDENANESDGKNGGDTYKIDPGTTIEFEANTAGWKGLAPSAIDGVENPTLVLKEEKDYEIGWTKNGGSMEHNFMIWNDSEKVVKDYETEMASEPGDDQMLKITATSEMAYYRCRPHTNMQGDIQIE
ncbi:plastocyanin/azurin family copper-binding protein [Halosolutus gelatinilyticus]|uniref:plastocyanin/azurin family copper-binding protein n=1 Tax=Halosolutus gelatinilyticus TaxID=2931975 RepID=UPI001FF3D3BE|nr:plastocyanin/azurin family copper-binding protein [Halosolutus gelatinilyticus]